MKGKNLQKKDITILTILFILSIYIPPVIGDSTILSAKRTSEIIELDGHALEDDWRDANDLVITVQDGSIGKVEVSLKALYDQDNLFIFATWPDATKSVEKDSWIFDGKQWNLTGNEDRIAFLWNIDDSISGFNIGGCAMLCHGDRMHTNDPSELGDLWHWKAGRTNPIGYAEDEWIDDTVVEGYTESAREAAFYVDGSQTIENEGYIKNINSGGDGPKYYEPAPQDPADSQFIFLSEVENGETVEVKENTRFNTNDSIPGYILRKPPENRGDIEAKGLWLGGRWQVEFRRKLNTGYDNDVQFDISKTYRFGISVMDNSGGFEAFGKGHSFDLGARTLEFGGKGSEEVTKLSLINDYLTVGEAHAKTEDFDMALSNIGDALILYNEISGEMAGLDPELYLSTKNKFMEIRRNPSLEGIHSLRDSIDTAMLTFQGKRIPTEATLKLRILVLWGSVQLYFLVILALLSLAPIYKAVQVGTKPTFRRLSVFILVIVIPLLFEGIGRVGILLKIPLLQNFSFLTNELATLQWAILMFFGLFLAKSGFEEVEKSMNSLESLSTELRKDIKKLKKLEVKLRSSEARYRGIFEASPIGIIEVKPNGEILNCNDSASTIFGCTKGNCNCTSFFDYIKDPNEEEKITTFLKEGGSLRDQFIHIKNISGKELTLSLSIESMLDENGNPIRSEIALMDVTDRITAEEEKRSLQKELANSEKLATVGKLAMGFAHEISNPLTNIQLAAEILSKKVGKAAKSRIDVISKNVEMASSVVRNLLDFSRQTQLNIVPLDLQQVIDESLEMLSPRLEEIDVVKNIGKLPEIEGDPKQLVQVFANIIINAIQAMPKGGKLTINTKREPSFIVVSFNDTGQGIPKDQLEKIFDPFYTTKEVGTGTGLGLSLTYGIVKAHGGDINIESALGKGQYLVKKTKN
jgi:PAS domain S-box-containing protein